MTITGTLSDTALAKPLLVTSGVENAVSSWSGGTLQVLDSSGTVVGTGTVNANGAYSASVAAGSNYFLRAQIGNLVLKALVPSATASVSVNINPASTAKVLVLANIAGVANLGDPAVNGTTALAAVNVATVLTQIEARSDLASLENAIVANIASGFNPNSSAGALGSADTTVSSSVATMASAITGGGSGGSGGTNTGSVNNTPDNCAGITEVPPAYHIASMLENGGKWTGGSIDWSAPSACAIIEDPTNYEKMFKCGVGVHKIAIALKFPNSCRTIVGGRMAGGAWGTQFIPGVDSNTMFTTDDPQVRVVVMISAQGTTGALDPQGNILDYFGLNLTPIYYPQGVIATVISFSILM